MTLLPEVREELVATATRRAGRRLQFGRGALPVGLAVACTVAVVVAAVVALGHRAPAPAISQKAGAGLGALEAKLAVLRRPQTSADRTYPRNLTGGRGVGTGVIARLTRLAATITTPGAGPVNVYVVVRKLPARRSRPDLIGVESFDRHGVPQGGTAVLTAAMLVPSAVGTGRIAGPGGRNPNAGVAVGLVPDGVTRVRWTFTGAGYGVLDPRPVVVYPRVQNNVAVAPVTSDEGPLAGAVWYGAHGQVSSSRGGAAAQAQLATINEVNASRHRPIAPALVAHYRLFRTVPPENLRRDWQLPTAGAGHDLNFWQTRYIGSLTGLDGRGLWITPGTDSLCISDWNAGDCGSLARISTGFIGGSTSNGRESTFEGLVPDGNPTVTFVLAGGARRTVPVTDNVYEATVRGRVVAVINRDIHGHVVRTTLQ